MKIRILLSTVAALAVATSAAAIATPAEANGNPGTTMGWHRVHEAAKPAPQEDLTLPAGKYCQGFDLKLHAAYQKVEGRVTTRWDDNSARTTKYDGPLITKATNLKTGRSVYLNLSGRARSLTRPDQTMATYHTDGPVGLGWPQDGGGNHRGYYLMTGRHAFTFTADGTRQMVADHGAEIDVCHLVG